jgi:hypothetical protein
VRQKQGKEGSGLRRNMNPFWNRFGAVPAKQAWFQKKEKQYEKRQP